MQRKEIFFTKNRKITHAQIHICWKGKSPEKEKARELLISQRVVNKIILEHKLNIMFLNAERTGENTILLHGVCESSDYVSQAITILEKSDEFKGYTFKSAISVSKERRIH